jgi:hypothetical protein
MIKIKKFMFGSSNLNKKSYILIYNYVEDIYYKRITYLNEHMNLVRKFEK